LINFIPSYQKEFLKNIQKCEFEIIPFQKKSMQQFGVATMQGTGQVLGAILTTIVIIRFLLSTTQN